MAENEIKAPFRIAIRQDEVWVTAYLAANDSMEDAVELGRIKVRLLKTAEGTWDRFQDLWLHACVAMLPEELQIGARAESCEPPEKRA